MANSASIDALRNAAMLQGAASPANMSDDTQGVFAGPRAGHVPTTGEMASGEANADNAATALGASPQLQALQHAADFNQRQDEAAQQREDADLENGVTGNRLALQAGAANQGAMVGSEGAAARQMAPNAQTVHAQTMADKLAEIQGQYSIPAAEKAQGDLAVADRTAQGHVASATERKGSQQDVGRAAVAKYLALYGSKADPHTLEQIKQLYGISDQPSVSGLASAASGVLPVPRPRGY